MATRGAKKVRPSKAQALRAAAGAAIERLAAGARGSGDPHAGIARCVLGIAIARCAEVHHPAGLARLRDAGLVDAGAGQEDAGARAEAEELLRAVEAPDPYELGAVHEALLGTALKEGERALVVTRGDARRSAGAHYTPAALAREVARRAIEFLLKEGARDEEVPALRVCDAAMGAGAFLLAACDVLAERLVMARGDGDVVRARREVARSCLFGVDKDPEAVSIARVALWIATASEEDPATFLAGSLRAGDALVGPPNAGPPWPRGIEPFDWGAAFPGVIGERGGFDVIVGNPPWISYAGRAAQPIGKELFRYYKRTSPAFFGYRNLQAVFVHRAATLLRPGGRLGLVVPTSMSDLGGYEPSRRAHDAVCEVDDVLPDFGHRFDDVFQPCMGLFSTRRAGTGGRAAGAPWPLERRDLDARAEALLAKLDALPKLPAAMFGERGFQTNGDDVQKLRPFSDAPRDGDVGLRIGSDVAAFRRAEPSLRCDPRDFGRRFREEASFRAVSVLVRQTARFPMACVSDGAPFRNSVLAGFATEEMPASMLAAYLNASPVRWFHYARHRDARQGMPQLKIAHLRALPCPRDDRLLRDALLAMGRALGDRNDGVRPEEQRALDDLVSELLGLDEGERSIVDAWARSLA